MIATANGPHKITKESQYKPANSNEHRKTNRQQLFTNSQVDRWFDVLFTSISVEKLVSNQLPSTWWHTQLSAETVAGSTESSACTEQGKCLTIATNGGLAEEAGVAMSRWPTLSHAAVAEVASSG